MNMHITGTDEDNAAWFSRQDRFDGFDRGDAGRDGDDGLSVDPWIEAHHEHERDIRKIPAHRAEGRHGTQRYRGKLASYYCKENGFTSCSTLLRATPRQWRLAVKLAEAPLREVAHRNIGRVQRALHAALCTEQYTDIPF